MSDQPTKQSGDELEKDNLEIEPLTDKDLEDVAGGAADVCSWSNCSNSAKAAKTA
jgi:hypothetical protein